MTTLVYHVPKPPSNHEGRLLSELAQPADGRDVADSQNPRGDPKMYCLKWILMNPLLGFHAVLGGLHCALQKIRDIGPLY